MTKKNLTKQILGGFSMNNYTINTYEMKRDIVNFSKKLSEGVNKSTSKFVMDIQFGLSKSGSFRIPK